MRARRTMVIDLDLAAASDPPQSASRVLVEPDASALAELMLAAYHGTIDYQGEGLDEAKAEVRRTFEGGYGPMLWEASFVIEAEPGGTGLLSASVITLWRGTPLLSCLMTLPRARRRGLAGGLIGMSARVLARQGHSRLELAVTRGNAAAEALYERLGFCDRG